MPRRVRPPTRYPAGGKLQTLTTKGSKAKAVPEPPAPKSKSKPSQASGAKSKAPSSPKQQKAAGPKRSEPSTSLPKQREVPSPVESHPRRSRSESRLSSNSGDEDFQPSIRVRNASESRLYRSRQQIALQDIYRLQSTTQLLIPKLSFSRVIREVLMEYMYRDFRITTECLNALQEASEMYLVQVFEDSYRCCLHRNRVTLDVPDMKLALYLREKWRP